MTYTKQLEAAKKNLKWMENLQTQRKRALKRLVGSRTDCRNGHDFMASELQSQIARNSRLITGLLHDIRQLTHKARSERIPTQVVVQGVELKMTISHLAWVATYQYGHETFTTHFALHHAVPTQEFVYEQCRHDVKFR